MKLYVDMDECLTAFNEAVKKLGPHAAEGLDPKASNLQKKILRDSVEKAGENFWSKMDWKNDGKELWAIVKPFNPSLLTSPGIFTHAQSGKILWVKKHIPGTTILFSTTKSEYVNPYETSILIDDLKKNISAWEAAGGIGILHQSTTTTERQLLELLWENPPQ